MGCICFKGQLSNGDVRLLQRYLRHRTSFDGGPADGYAGTRTTVAFKQLLYHAKFLSRDHAQQSDFGSESEDAMASWLESEGLDIEAATSSRKVRWAALREFLRQEFDPECIAERKRLEARAAALAAGRIAVLQIVLDASTAETSSSSAVITLQLHDTSGTIRASVEVDACTSVNGLRRLAEEQCRVPASEQQLVVLDVHGALVSFGEGCQLDRALVLPLLREACGSSHETSCRRHRRMVSWWGGGRGHSKRMGAVSPARPLISERRRERIVTAAQMAHDAALAEADRARAGEDAITVRQQEITHRSEQNLMRPVIRRLELSPRPDITGAPAEVNLKGS